MDIYIFFIYNYIYLSNKRKGYVHKLNVFAKYFYITIITIKLITQTFRLLSGQCEFLPNSYLPVLYFSPLKFSTLPSFLSPLPPPLSYSFLLKIYNIRTITHLTFKRKTVSTHQIIVILSTNFFLKYVCLTNFYYIDLFN